MCRFIETIRVENGRALSLPYHQKRVNESLLLTGGGSVRLSLAGLLGNLPTTEGVFKARIVYDNTGKVLEQSLSPYTPKKVRTLRLVDCDDIDYSLKYADRTRLNALAARVGSADEIIIVRHGKLTDTSYSNIALYDGKNWFTPRIPLLRGTMRQSLIDEGVIQEADITPADLGRYRKVSLINAMMPLGTCCADTESIDYKF